LAANYDRQLSARSLNDFNFAYSRLFVKFGGGCTVSSPGCIPDPTQIDQAFTFMSFGGAFGTNSKRGLGNIGPATNLPQGRIVEALQFRDNYSRTMGNHQIQAGVDIRRLRNSVPFLPVVNGSFSFTSAARYVANDPTQVALAVGTPTIQYYETDQFYYFQDDWKVRDNLTLNLGIRYENTGQPINTLHNITTATESNPNTAIWLQSLPLSIRTVPKIPTDDNNFAPRIGFAYTPRFWKKVMGEDATVIRGGYSIAYDPAFYNILLNVSTSTPEVFNNTTNNPAPGGTVLFPLPSNPTGPNVRAFAAASKIVAVNTFDPRSLTQTIVDPKFRSPYAEQWSLGFQRQINKSNVVEVRYLGTHGVGLFQQAIVNPQFNRLLNGFTANVFGAPMTFPGFPNLVPAGLTPTVCPAYPGVNHVTCDGRILPQARILSRQNSGQSIYHSLQARYSGRLFNQFSYGVSYTFSKALDNASEIFTFQEIANAQDPFNTGKAERSYSGFDRRNALSMNGIWDIPLHKDQQGLVGHLLGGWQLNGTYVLTDGLRYTPRQTLNNLLLGGPTYVDFTTGDTGRPFVGNPNADPKTVGITDIDANLMFGVTTKSPTGFYSLNDLNHGTLTAVTKQDVRYIVVGPGSAKLFGTPFGNAARNSLIGPLLNQFNMGLFKNTRLKERLTLQLRVEAFNVFNHPNPGYGLDSAPGNINGSPGAIPDNLINNAGFSFNDGTQVEKNRRILQFGVRVVF